MGDVYAIILHESDSDLWETVREKWEARHILTPTVAFVRDPKRTTSEIAQELEPREDRLLVVFDLTQCSYSGLSYSALWEWFANGRRA